MFKAPIEYTPDFVMDGQASSDFRRLWNELDWKRVTRRREYWTNVFDRSYSYGKPEYARVYESQPMHPVIAEYHKALYFATQTNYEGCFLNGYETGRDALAWHADDDPGIDHSKAIAIVTLYDGPVHHDGIICKSPDARPARVIQFMPQDGTKADVESVEMAHGSLIIMKPGMQSTHFHQIPKAGFDPRPRISLTFRGLTNVST